MIKQFILLIHFMGLFFYQLIFTTGVSVKQEFVNTMTPGSDVVVSIVINKQDITGFAKVQQELPVGFIAEVIDSRGATFSFKDNKVKMIWMALPTEAEFTVKYKLTALASTTGDFTLNGKFSYIADSERKNIDMAPKTLSVTSEVIATVDEESTENTEGTIDTEDAVNADDAIDVSENIAEEVAEETINNSNNEDAVVDDNVIAETAAISINGDRNIELMGGDKYKVTLNINKENIEGFTKITETIPSGFIASSDQNQGGVFSFKDREAKIMWLTIPEENVINVSYILTPISAENGNYSIDGKVSYLENDVNQVYNIETSNLTLDIEQEVVVEEIEEEIVEEAIEETSSGNEDQSLGSKLNDAMNNTKGVEEEVIDEVAIEETSSGNEDQSLGSKLNDAMNNTKGVEEEVIDEVAEEVMESSEVADGAVDIDNGDQETKVVEEQDEVVTSIEDITSVPKPETGVSYKIQVAALRKQVPSDYISKKFKLLSPISIESHEGWSKYILGNHSVYRDAKNERDSVRKKVKRAFVTAYNQGERITVQEALMISNQKWYK